MSTTIHPETILGPVPRAIDIREKAKAASGYPFDQIHDRNSFACGGMSAKIEGLLEDIQSAMEALDANDSEHAYDILYRASKSERGEIPNSKYRDPEPDHYKEAREREDAQ